MNTFEYDNDKLQLLKAELIRKIEQAKNSQVALYNLRDELADMIDDWLIEQDPDPEH